MKIESMSTIQVKVELKRLGVINPPGNRDEAIKLYQELSGCAQEPVKTVPIEIPEVKPEIKPEPVKEPEKVPIEEGKPKEGEVPVPVVPPPPNEIEGVVIVGFTGNAKPVFVSSKPDAIVSVIETPAEIPEPVKVEEIKHLPKIPVEDEQKFEEISLSTEDILFRLDKMDKYKFVQENLKWEIVCDVLSILKNNKEV